MQIADNITLKNFLNVYFRNITLFDIRKESEISYIYYVVSENLALKIQLKYYSLTGRHLYQFPVYLLNKEFGSSKALELWEVVELLLNKLSFINPKLKGGHTKFISQMTNSHANLQLIFKNLNIKQIEQLFSSEVDFSISEGALLGGHQMHPNPKSCSGFTNEQIIKYYPEMGNSFQMHYFLVHSDNAHSQSNLELTTNELINQYFLNKPINTEGVLLPLHPWQAEYVKELPVIKRMLSNGKLKDLGAQGQYFNATSSIRTVYAPSVPYMLKLSLNVMITNSVRMQYARELERAIAVDNFWQTNIGTAMLNKYPNFMAIDDPAFVCLKDDDKLIEETAALFRTNSFRDRGNNVTCLAALCQDSPHNDRNRFNELITNLAIKLNIPINIAANTWFNKFLTVGIEPLLWLFTHYEIALEAHQQNLLIKLNQDGMPEQGYYRDSQGYYISYSSIKNLNEHQAIWQHFAQGDSEFITHHFTYYLICNSVFGVINALGISRTISEAELAQQFRAFILTKIQQWPKVINNYLTNLVKLDTLPFKDNLQTRLYNLDELTAPLEQQSIYIDIINPLKID